MKLVAFDLETTGLEMERDRVLEFSFLELGPDLKELGRWSRLVDPGINVPKEIEELTGISTDMVKGQPPFSAHAPRIQKLVHDAVLVAHNHSFDLPFLDMELRRSGQPGLAPDHRCIDTLVIERHVNSHRLGEVYRRYVGTPFDGSHRSEADVLATVEVLRRQREQHSALLPPNGLEGLTAASVDRHFGGGKRVRHWLDHGHRFYRDDAGVIRFGFGPHRTCPAIQVHACVNGVSGHHEEFLRWMLRRDFPAEAKVTVEMMLRANSPRPFSAPGPASPAAADAAASPGLPLDPPAAGVIMARGPAPA